MGVGGCSLPGRRLTNKLPPVLTQHLEQDRNPVPKRCKMFVYLAAGPTSSPLANLINTRPSWTQRCNIHTRHHHHYLQANIIHHFAISFSLSLWTGPAAETKTSLAKQREPRQ